LFEATYMTKKIKLYKELVILCSHACLNHRQNLNKKELLIKQKLTNVCIVLITKGQVFILLKFN
jgi:hypothetical protein